ncbi:YciI family protein [Roseibium alexandrii]|uniref:YciI family protein n=1 Tax=Roseibium alexandrii TaxID=388408 RepID=UPI003750335D
MQFVVYAIDKPDALRLRLEVLEAHRHFLGTEPEKYGVKILLSGPLTEDDGSTMRGSFFLLEADNREKIKDMFANDPLQAAGVWAEQQISTVTVRQNNMRTDQ